MMAIYRRHLTETELGALCGPNGTTNPEFDARWAKLIAVVDRAMRDAVPTESEVAQALAWRWVRLVITMTGNDAKLATKLMAIQVTEDRAQDLVRITPEKIRWISEALAHARTTLFAKYLNPQETETVRHRQLANRSYMTDWPALVALVRGQLDAGTAVEADAVLQLASRWQQLFHESYCGDDARLEAKVREVIRLEPAFRMGVGIDEELIAYVQMALAQLKYRTHTSRNFTDEFVH